MTSSIFQIAPKIYGLFSATSLAPWFSTPWQGEQNKETEKSTSSVIIGGYGPLGQHLASKLEQSGISYQVIELNPDTVKTQQADNKPIIFGDISNKQVLNSLNLQSVSVFAITHPDTKSSRVSIAIAIKLSKKLMIIARTPTERDHNMLIKAGANKVIIDENASAQEMYQVISNL